jgi:hypothetical protein
VHGHVHPEHPLADTVADSDRDADANCDPHPIGDADRHANTDAHDHTNPNAVERIGSAQCRATLLRAEYGHDRRHVHGRLCGPRTAGQCDFRDMVERPNLVFLPVARLHNQRRNVDRGADQFE